MQVRKLDTERRRDVWQFVAYPFQLYDGSPDWVPSLVSDARRLLDRRRHPFYDHSPADFSSWSRRGRPSDASL